MDVDNLIRNLRALGRAQTIIADIQLQHFMTRVGLQVAAGVIALFGLLMLELAAFWALRDVWGEVIAALALGGANFAIALFLLLVAALRRPGRELDVAREVQTTAIQSLQLDARTLQNDVVSFASAVRHPFETVIPTIVVPLVTMLVQSLRRKKPDPEA